MPKPERPVYPTNPREMKDQASYIINDGKPKRGYVQQAAPTNYGPLGEKHQSINIYINKYMYFIGYK